MIFSSYRFQLLIDQSFNTQYNIISNCFDKVIQTEYHDTIVNDHRR